MPNDAVDTSREAVERDVQTVVAIFDEDGEGLPLSLHSLTEKCRALLARAERAEKLYSEAQRHADHWAKERDAAVAEAGRLREALKKIADSQPWTGRAPLAEIARAALEGGAS